MNEMKDLFSDGLIHRLTEDLTEDITVAPVKKEENPSAETQDAAGIFRPCAHANST